MNTEHLRSRCGVQANDCQRCLANCLAVNARYRRSYMSWWPDPCIVALDEEAGCNHVLGIVFRFINVFYIRK